MMLESDPGILFADVRSAGSSLPAPLETRTSSSQSSMQLPHTAGATSHRRTRLPISRVRWFHAYLVILGAHSALCLVAPPAAKPELRVHALERLDAQVAVGPPPAFLILACDGVWDGERRMRWPMAG